MDKKKLFAHLGEQALAGSKKYPKASARMTELGLGSEVGYLPQNFFVKWEDSLKAAALKHGILQATKTGLSSTYQDSFIWLLRNDRDEVVNIAAQAAGGESTIQWYDHFGMFPAYPPTTTTHLIITEDLVQAATVLPQIEGKATVLALYDGGLFTTEHSLALTAASDTLEEVTFAVGKGKHANELIELLTAKVTGLLPRIKLFRCHYEQGANFALAYEARIPLHHQVPDFEFNPFTIRESEEVSLEGFGLDVSDAPDHIRFHSDVLQLEVFGFQWQQAHAMPCTVKASLADGSPRSVHRAYLNLSDSRSTERYAEAASKRLAMSPNGILIPLNDLVSRLEKWSSERRKKSQQIIASVRVPGNQRQRAQKLLQSSALMDDLLALMQQSGLPGKSSHDGLLGLVVSLTRFLDRQLALVIGGEEGKSYLINHLIATTPEEQLQQAAIMTSNSLYFADSDFYRHRVLVVRDLDRHLKLTALQEIMQGRLTKLYAKADKHGEIRQRVIDQPTSTVVVGESHDPSRYYQIADYAFFLEAHPDTPEDRQKRTAWQQRYWSGGIDQREIDTARQMLKNLQRLLRTDVFVINPFPITLPEGIYRSMHGNLQLHVLIQAVALLRQWSKPVQEHHGRPSITATIEDVEWAMRLSRRSLLRKADELNYRQRDLYQRMVGMTQADSNQSLNSRRIRQQLGITPMQCSRLLKDLTAYGLLDRVGGSRHAGFEYVLTGLSLDQGSTITDALDRQLEQWRSAMLASTGTSDNVRRLHNGA